MLFQDNQFKNISINELSNTTTSKNKNCGEKYDDAYIKATKTYRRMQILVELAYGISLKDGEYMESVRFNRYLEDIESALHNFYNCKGWAW